MTAKHKHTHSCLEPFVAGETKPASRSQQRRDALAVTALSERLVNLSVKNIQQLPLSPELIHQILFGRSLKMGARKRQVLYIAKFLRQLDLATLSSLLKIS